MSALYGLFLHGLNCILFFPLEQIALNGVSHCIYNARTLRLVGSMIMSEIAQSNVNIPEAG